MGLPQHPLASKALHRFLLIHRHLRAYARQIDAQRLHPRQFAALLFLLEQGPATVSEVQDHFYTSASPAPTLISQLENSGYLTRTGSETDNRVVIAALTPAGWALAEQTPLGGILLLRRSLDSLPEDRLRMLDDAMSDVMRLMEVREDE